MSTWTTTREGLAAAAQKAADAYACARQTQSALSSVIERLDALEADNSRLRALLDVPVPPKRRKAA